MTVLHVKFHIKIWNGFLSHVPQKRADRKKDNFVSNEFQPPLMFCAGHVTRFFIQYRFIYKSESKFFSQYSQVRVCHLQEFSHIRFTNIFFNSILVITDFCYMFRKNGLIEKVSLCEQQIAALLLFWASSPHYNLRFLLMTVLYVKLHPRNLKPIFVTWSATTGWWYERQLCEQRISSPSCSVQRIFSFKITSNVFF